MIEIRRFAPGDERPIRELISGVMTQEFKDEQSAYPTDDIEDIQRAYGGLGEAFFVAVSGGDIVGTVAVKKEDERVALMRRLFVSPEHRKKKIGFKLIDRVMKFCDEAGYREVIFKTTSRMAGANSICQKKGFIQRAKINLGAIELLKFSLALHPVKS